jgi:hypothetical protein
MKILEIKKLSRVVKFPELDFLVGILHANGYGVNYDIDKADQLFLQAAQGGIALAQYMVGEKLLSNASDTKQQLSGIEWLKKAAQNGLSVAAYRLSMHYRESDSSEKHETLSVEWNAKAAEQGFPLAEYFYGKHFETGYGGLNIDFARSIYWYQKAAEHGCNIAIRRLADAYKYGELNLSVDQEKFLSLNAAADENDKQNTTLEKEDWIAAARNGDRFVAKLLVSAYREGIYGFPLDSEQADYWENRFQ